MTEKVNLKLNQLHAHAAQYVNYLKSSLASLKIMLFISLHLFSGHETKKGILYQITVKITSFVFILINSLYHQC